MDGRQPESKAASLPLHAIPAYLIIYAHNWEVCTRVDRCFRNGEQWEDGCSAGNAKQNTSFNYLFWERDGDEKNGIRKSLKIIIGGEEYFPYCWLANKERLGVWAYLLVMPSLVKNGAPVSCMETSLLFLQQQKIRPDYELSSLSAFPFNFRNDFSASIRNAPFAGRAPVMLLIGIYTMKSDRSLGYHASKNLTRMIRKQSNTTTLTNSSASSRMRAKSFHDEPFPQELARRLLGPKLKPLDLSEEEEEGSVVAEQEEGECLQRKRTIPHFIVMSDHGQFAGRGRPREALPRGSLQQRCRSVQLLRLPQVDEQKREEDEKGMPRGRLLQFKDRNEFGQRKSVQVTPLMDLDSKEGHFGSVPQLILQAEAEEYPIERPNRHDRSAYCSEMGKIKVDEVDQHPRSREEQQDIQQIAEEERQEEETASVKKLRLSLQKLEHEGEYLSKFKEKELRVSIHEEEEEEEETQTRQQPKRGRVEQVEENSQ